MCVRSGVGFKFTFCQVLILAVCAQNSDSQTCCPPLSDCSFSTDSCYPPSEARHSGPPTPSTPNPTAKPKPTFKPASAAKPKPHVQADVRGQAEAHGQANVRGQAEAHGQAETHSTTAKLSGPVPAHASPGPTAWLRSHSMVRAYHHVMPQD